MHKSNWQAQQLILSKQWDFFRRAGGDKNGVGDIRQVKFSYTRNTTDPKDPSKSIPQKVELDVPLIAIVKVPNLSIKTVDITFDMEVKSHFATSESEDSKAGFSGDASYNMGFFSVSVHVEGSVAAHKEQTRSSDSSAKYHVEVRAEDNGIPEGLARVLDIINRSITDPPAAAALPKN
jgi:hypothetical protein